MIEARPAALDHVRGEYLRAVDHAPEIDREQALPVLQRTEHLCARRDAGIVHQDVGAAETLFHRALKRRDFFDAADVDR